MRRVYLEINWLPVDAFVASRYSRSLGLDFSLHLGEVIPPPAWNVMKFRPLFLSRDACWCVWHMDFIATRLVVSLAGEIDEL
jgi:hypothetical protein